MPQCVKPRCAKRKTGCVCPNSWVIYQSRQAAIRRREHGSRLTRAQHSQLYKAAKDRGEFQPTSAGPCKTNVDKLCKWHNQKDMGWPFVGRDMGAFYRLQHARAGQRLLRGKIGIGFSDDSGHNIDAGQRQYYADVMRLPANLKLHRLLGRGIAGQVFSARDTRTGKWLAVKMQVLKTQADKVDFEQEVFWQRRFHHHQCALAIEDAWTAPWADLTAGVMVMEPIDGVLEKYFETTLPTSQHDVKLIRNHLAHQIKRLYDHLQSAGLVHGDMHFENIAVHFARGPQFTRRFPNIVFLDTGRSFEKSQNVVFQDGEGFTAAEKSLILNDADRFWVWRAATQFNQSMCEPLRAAKFPGSRIMREITGFDKPTPDQAGGLDELDGHPWVDALLRMQQSVHANLHPVVPLPVRR